jgi:hypothetical protein
MLADGAAGRRQFICLHLAGLREAAAARVCRYSGGPVMLA